ncbi:hypothetical protein AB0D59_46580 [Streptomyces sp. NPDC048417]|uniref:hypothetical protein n=1 Tax=Streptomyces sp. NPDC048417 TaxID=3155387 RepID=UPI0034318292
MPQDFMSCTTLALPAGSSLSPRERIGELAAHLRAVEQQCSGLRRERWGYAAANAEAAAAAGHPSARRWLWATACDYARLAAEGGTDVLHSLR